MIARLPNRWIVGSVILAIVAALVVVWGGLRAIDAGPVGFSKIEFDNQEQRLHISGGLIESLHVVRDISTVRRGNDILVRMRVSLPWDSLLRRGMTGNFDFTIPIGPDVQRVLFGAEEKEIWKRSSR